MSWSSFEPGYGASLLTPWVKRLLIANAAIFLFMWISGSAGFFVEWFAFRPSRILTRPWGALTYMFLHAGFWHVFINMLMLFFFGRPLERRWGSREFIKYYLLCGLGGVALSFVFQSSSIIGASAAVYGLMVAFAMTWPDAPIYIWGIFPVKAKWLAAFLFVVSTLSAFGGGGDGIAHFAHLGGLVTGFVYLRTDWRTPEWLRGRGGAGSSRPGGRFGSGTAPGGRSTRSQSSPGARRGGRRADEEALLDEVDAILDKISRSGMRSLTRKELELLNEVSRRRRSS
ncbi:MAG: rhomboid family intramembrane serine protease [Gammaproteobacteria bacterium]|nr:rhomboid family intramembrane serine protease [Gammaproteobacteria bacterium]